MTKIYLVTNINDDPFTIYVGKTHTKKGRKISHEHRFGKQIRYDYIDEIDSFDSKDWKPLECYWIEQFKQWGFKLLNINSGGGGPTLYSEFQKSKMRKPRMKGTGNKISKSLREGNHSQYYTNDVKKLMSIQRLGIPLPFSEEHKKNMGIAKMKQAKSIIQLNLEGIQINRFKCLRLAKEWMLFNFDNVSINIDKQIKDCCVGRQKTCYTFKWKYE